MSQWYVLCQGSELTVSCHPLAGDKRGIMVGLRGALEESFRYYGEWQPCPHQKAPEHPLGDRGASSCHTTLSDSQTLPLSGNQGRSLGMSGS